MKSEGLRIGNLVRYGSLVSEVIEIKRDSFCTSPLKTDMFNEYGGCQKATTPIEICDGQLLNLGFSEYPGYDVNQYEKVTHLFCIGEDKEFSVKRVVETYGGNEEVSLSFFHGDNWIKRIEFVHDLQNIYFAIKGKDLVYKRKIK